MPKAKYTPSRKAVELFYLAILKLIDYQKKILKDPAFIQSRASMDDLHWKKELATVKIQLPRRGGNTTVAIKLLKFLKKSICLTYDEGSARNMGKQCEAISEITLDRETRVCSVNSLNNLRGKKFEVIIVDTTFMIPEKKISEIYKLNALIYVFLG